MAQAPSQAEQPASNNWSCGLLRVAERAVYNARGDAFKRNLIVRKCEDSAAALQEGVKIAQEMLAEVRPYVQGVQVSAPFGKIPHALEVFEVLR
jgi:hypothetical protein